MNNGAAIGYALLAAKQLGLNQAELRQLESLMKDEMDFVSEEEAEEVYQKS